MGRPRPVFFFFMNHGIGLMRPATVLEIEYSSNPTINTIQQSKPIRDGITNVAFNNDCSHLFNTNSVESLDSSFANPCVSSTLYRLLRPTGELIKQLNTM